MPESLVLFGFLRRTVRCDDWVRAACHSGLAVTLQSVPIRWIKLAVLWYEYK